MLEQTERIANLRPLQKAYLKIKELQKAVNNKVNSNDDFVAVIGMACRFPENADTPEKFWDNLINGKNSIREVPQNRWAESLYDSDVEMPGKMSSKWGGFFTKADLFDEGYFEISPKEASFIDPQQRLLLMTVQEALENAFIQPSTLNGSDTGVFVGIGGADYGMRLASSIDKTEIGPYLGSGNSLSAAAGRISFFYGLNGPAMSVDTACSSSLVSVHHACQALLLGDCKVAISSGVNLIIAPHVQISLSKARMMASDGHCKTFDKAADGYVRSDGCGVVVLKKLKDAVKDGDEILAVIRSSTIAQDGKSGGLTVPNQTMQEYIINKSIEKAGISVNDLDYIEAHGTGTSLGDPIEIGAIANVLAKNGYNKRIKVGAVKTNIGHLEAAAGIAGLIKTILALNNEVIPPNLHFHQPSPYIKWNQIPIDIPTIPIQWKKGEKKRFAGISSFGFTGTIGHLIIEEAPEKRPISTNEIPSSETAYAANISAKSEGALKLFAQKFIAFLEGTIAQWKDIAYTLNYCRDEYEYKVALSGMNNQAIISQLNAFLKGETFLKPKASFPSTGKKIRLPNYAFDLKSFWLINQDNFLEREDYADLTYQIKWTPLVVNDSKEQVTWKKWKTHGIIPTDLSQFRTIPAFHHSENETLNGNHTASSILTFIEVPKDDFELNNIKGQLYKNLKETLSLLKNTIKEQEQTKEIKLLFCLQNEDFNRKEVDLLIAPLVAFVKVFTLENPFIKVKFIEYDHSESLNRILESEEINDPQYFHFRVTDNSVYHSQLVPISKDVTGKKPFEISSDEQDYFLITGGTGSLGMLAARWLVARGAANLVLLSRRGVWSDNTQGRKELAESKANIFVEKADITSKADLKAVLEKMERIGKKLKGVIHTAGINRHSLIAETTWDSIEEVCKAKVDGTMFLHELTKSMPLDFFIMYSSVSSVWGSGLLGHYAAANAYMDAMAAYRQAQNLPGLSLSWGAWKGSTMVDINNEERLLEAGNDFLLPESTNELLDYVNALDSSHLTIARINWSRFLEVMELNHPLSFFEVIRAKKVNKKATENGLSNGLGLAEQWKKLDSVVRWKEVEKYLSTVIAKTLGYEDASNIKKRIAFQEQGMDSIMVVKLVNQMKNEIGVDLSTSIFYNYPNLIELADYLNEQMEVAKEAMEIIFENESSQPEQLPNFDDINEDELLALVETDLEKYDLNEH